MPAGRPRIVLTDEELNQLEVLAGMGAPQEDIASWFGMSVDTLMRNFAEPLKRGSSKVNNRLRMAQYQSAIGNEKKKIKPNPTLQIWLGKQLLGQSDKFEVGNKDNEGFEFVQPTKETK